MVFSSYEFIFLFLPLAFAAYHACRAILPFRVASLVLVIFSLFFYAYWEYSLLVVIAASIVINYGIAYLIYNTPYKRQFVTIGVVLNLLYLGYFKYFNFLIFNINQLGGDITFYEVVLPLGISFFTFQQITFLVDTCNNREKLDNFIDYCLFITFFPHLVAGPIVHHQDMMPQFESMGRRRIGSDKLSLGIYLFSIGLAKKVLIADQLSSLANAAFAKDTHLLMHEAWLGAFAYTFQLYFDFSGYATMALGLALFFGISLPINFNSPYKSVSIQDFWRRWHITLSRFLREFVYIPAGGNRLSSARTNFNLFITFVIGGIWHGAAWNYVFWGVAHGAALVLHRAWGRSGMKLPLLAAWSVTFIFVVLTWVLFRSPDMNTALSMYASMVDVQSSGNLFNAISTGTGVIDLQALFPALKPTILNLLILASGAVIAFFAPNAAQLALRFKGGLGQLVFALILFCAAVWNMETVNEFLYFDF